MAFRSGFVSVIGRPNAGKSTLVNALVGEKVAIVTRKPQTTRNRIHGVLEVPAKKGSHPAAQIVFVDTPGIHKPHNLLDKRMLQEVYEALASRDIVLHVVDVTRRLRLPQASRTEAGRQEASERKAPEHARREHSLDNEDAYAMELIGKLDCPVFLLLNKIDEIRKEELLPLIAQFSALHSYAEVIPISARAGDGLERLVAKLVEHLPTGKRHFPRGQFTDQPERFLVAELIRERILNLTGEEIPYASAVVIERFEERAENKQQSNTKAPGSGRSKLSRPLTRIAAAIYCERSGQKAILIGKGGSMLKQIGTAARKEIEAMLGTQVYLELFVKVADDWRGSQALLDSMDWRQQLEALGERQRDKTEE